ncbi:hypothetical protein CVR96_27975, partial [Salmonella enterica subsp. enterica serovar Typhimurium]|uniref:hypothetical protein n=1 Tax=Salmonella enterica TaxID=28901 RepID=UPI000CA6A4EB
DDLSQKVNDRTWAVRNHAEDEWVAPANQCLNDLTLDELIRALYIGYNVQPELNFGDWVYHLVVGYVGKVIEVFDDKIVTVDIEGDK